MVSGKSKGVTLIELLFVTAIIGILAATAIPSFKTYMRQAELQSAEIVLKQAIDAYSVANDYSPAMLEDLVTDGVLTDIPNDPFTALGSDTLLAANQAEGRRIVLRLMDDVIAKAYAAMAGTGVEEAGDWYYENDGQNITFYALSHPGREYQLTSFGLPPGVAPPSGGTPAPVPTPAQAMSVAEATAAGATLVAEVTSAQKNLVKQAGKDRNDLIKQAKKDAKGLSKSDGEQLVADATAQGDALLAAAEQQQVDAIAAANAQSAAMLAAAEAGVPYP